MTLPPEYFKFVYDNSDDPWNFETSAYEAAKYARTLAALPQQHYAHGLEIGCSIGVLTAQLAPRVAHLTALDLNEKALELARQRLVAAGLLGRVSLMQRRLPAELPPGPFDLALLSEVLYYLSPGDLEAALDAVIERLSPGGTLLLVHWTPFVHDYPQTGDEVHTAALARAGSSLRHLHSERHGDEREGYRLDLFERL